MSETNRSNDEIHYKVMDILENQPQISQRELSQKLGISLGKLNYCLKALLDKGLVKANNFKTSQNKRGYLYVLTPKGIDEKSRMTLRFLKRKMAEFDVLKAEIEELSSQIESG